MGATRLLLPLLPTKEGGEGRGEEVRLIRFPLTPALSRRERENHRQRVLPSKRAARSSDGMRDALAPRERAGVRAIEVETKVCFASCAQGQARRSVQRVKSSRVAVLILAAGLHWPCAHAQPPDA